MVYRRKKMRVTKLTGFGPTRKNTMNMTRVGSSMIIQPRRFGNMGPQPFLECRPYGTVIIRRTGKRMIPNAIQIFMSR
jgi:hypothetical protein